MLYKSSLVKDPKEIEEVYSFIKKHPMDYPGHDEWCQKAYRETVLGYKKIVAILNTDKKGNIEVVGSILFQPDKQDPSVLEMKNIRVAEKYRKIRIFTRLLSDVEKYAKEQGFKRLYVDAGTDYKDIISALGKRGFSVVAKENLYSNERLEVLFAKDVRKGIITSVDTAVMKAIQELKLEMLKTLRWVIALVNRQ